MITDIISTITVFLTVTLFVIEVRESRWQTKFNMQMETMNGIYACIVILGSRRQWSYWSHQINKVDELGPVSDRLAKLNAWLSNPLCCDVGLYNTNEQITPLYVKKIWFQTKNLWPEECAKEAIDFLHQYSRVQNQILIAMNRFAVEHPASHEELAFNMVADDLMPAYKTLIESECLEKMECYMQKKKWWIFSCLRRVLTKSNVNFGNE